MLALAHRVLAEIDDFHNQLEELTGLLRGTIRIGGTWPVGPYDLFAVLAELRDRGLGRPADRAEPADHVRAAGLHGTRRGGAASLGG